MKKSFLLLTKFVVGADHRRGPCCIDQLSLSSSLVSMYAKHLVEH